MKYENLNEIRNLNLCTIGTSLVAVQRLLIFCCSTVPRVMALRGLKVVEMAGLAPAPMAGMILAGQ